MFSSKLGSADYELVGQQIHGDLSANAMNMRPKFSDSKRGCDLY